MVLQEVWLLSSLASNLLFLHLSSSFTPLPRHELHQVPTPGLLDFRLHTPELHDCCYFIKLDSSRYLVIATEKKKCSEAKLIFRALNLGCASETQAEF